MKTAIITGASSGLGREFVRQAAEVFPEIECYWLIARRADRLEEVAQLLPQDKQVCTLALDLCDTMSFMTFREKLMDEQPEVALLVNNAGCGYLGNIGEMPTTDQTRMVDLNVRALTAMTNGGAVHGRGQPHSECFLHCLLLSQSPDDGVFRHQGLCHFLHCGPFRGAEEPGHWRHRCVSGPHGYGIPLCGKDPRQFQNL